MASIIILAGPPSAGKTTVSRDLVKLWDGPLALIEGDVFWRFFAKPKEGADTRENFVTLMRSALAAATQFYRTGHSAIVDFSVPPGFLDAAKKIAREAPLDYVVLRPSEALCADRAAARDEGKMPDYEPFRRLYSLFDAAPAQNIISDDRASAADIAHRIKGGLELGQFRIA